MRLPHPPLSQEGRVALERFLEALDQVREAGAAVLPHLHGKERTLVIAGIPKPRERAALLSRLLENES